MGKGLHKVFNTVVKETLKDLPTLGESGSEAPIYFQSLETFMKLQNYHMT